MRTITFPNVPSPSWPLISYAFFLLMLGGWGNSVSDSDKPFVIVFWFEGGRGGEGNKEGKKKRGFSVHRVICYTVGAIRGNGICDLGLQFYFFCSKWGWDQQQQQQQQRGWGDSEAVQRVLDLSHLRR